MVSPDGMDEVSEASGNGPSSNVGMFPLRSLGLVVGAEFRVEPTSVDGRKPDGAPQVR